MLGMRLASSSSPFMRGNYIDFISAYCDRWCERCAFTDQCSVYAVQVATAMCDGDVAAGLELAVGAAPAEEDEYAEEAEYEHLLEDLAEPTQEEAAKWERDREEQDERLDHLPVTTTTETTWLLANRWLEDNTERLCANAAPAVADALQVAGWDCFFIPVKLHRALQGRDTFQRGDSPADDPVQNDWNGTAKVALISIVRSIHAWDVLAETSADPDARQVADALRTLRLEVEQSFPDAWKFIRPGFDAATRPRQQHD